MYKECFSHDNKQKIRFLSPFLKIKKETFIFFRIFEQRPNMSPRKRTKHEKQTQIKNKSSLGNTRLTQINAQIHLRVYEQIAFIVLKFLPQSNKSPNISIVILRFLKLNVTIFLYTVVLSARSVNWHSYIFTLTRFLSFG